MPSLLYGTRVCMRWSANGRRAVTWISESEPRCVVLFITETKPEMSLTSPYIPFCGAGWLASRLSRLTQFQIGDFSAFPFPPQRAVWLGGWGRVNAQTGEGGTGESEAISLTSFHSMSFKAIDANTEQRAIRQYNEWVLCQASCIRRLTKAFDKSTKGNYNKFSDRVRSRECWDWLASERIGLLPNLCNRIHNAKYRAENEKK